MESKEHILAAIRKQRVPPRELPNLQQSWITYPDRLAQFTSAVESVGGRCLPVEDNAAANVILNEMPAYSAAREIVSLVPGVANGNLDLETIDDPHRLETLDFAIIPGQFGVAENGAIWVSATGVKHRATFFICQHLAIVLPWGELVDNMHQAYERLSFGERKFGTFISGPSKTADIEQSLVIGAHGPRSLTVFCIRNV